MAAWAASAGLLGASVGSAMSAAGCKSRARVWKQWFIPQTHARNLCEQVAMLPAVPRAYACWLDAPLFRPPLRSLKCIASTCPALAPEVDRLDGTLLLCRSRQRVELSHDGVTLLGMVPLQVRSRVKSIRQTSGSRRRARVAPKAIRQPTVAHGRSDVLGGARDLIACLSAVSHQSQGHEALLPHLIVHATGHFGVSVPNRLLCVWTLYDIGIALAPPMLGQTHPGHEGARGDPVGFVDACASAHAHVGGRRRHARAGGCAQKFWRVALRIRRRRALGARSGLFRRIQHLGSASVATRARLGTVRIRRALFCLQART